MTNWEWLEALANNSPDELQAWFDSEHVETANATSHGDTEPENGNTDAVSERYATAFKWLDRLNYGKGGDEPNESVVPAENVDAVDNGDSRDKIEADMREIADAYNMDTQRHGTERFEHELYYSIMHLLDRQAAITEREWIDTECAKCGARENERDRDFAELQAQVDELQEQLRIGWECECRLQAERDKFKEANDYHAAQYELASEDCDRLQAQVDELKAERVKLRSQICKLEDDLVGTSDERDNWKANCEDWKKHARAAENACYETMLEREDYRKKFGKCIDYADAIHALMDDEGLA